MLYQAEPRPDCVSGFLCLVILALCYRFPKAILIYGKPAGFSREKSAGLIFFGAEDRGEFIHGCTALGGVGVLIDAHGGVRT